MAKWGECHGLAVQIYAIMKQKYHSPCHDLSYQTVYWKHSYQCIQLWCNQGHVQKINKDIL